MNDRHAWVTLHVPKADRLGHADNVREVREIRRRYPHIVLVLAHLGRCYTEPHALEALPQFADDPGLFFDTSAVLNPASHRIALQHFGPQRLLYGSDNPIFYMRGRRQYHDRTYINRTSHPFHFNTDREPPKVEAHYTLFMYEDLRAIKQACEELGITGRPAIEAIFHDNAARLIDGILRRQTAASPGKCDMKTVRFGIIGCGLMGREFASASARWCHLLHTQARPEIVAVSDQHPAPFDWFRQHFPSVRQFSHDYRELLANPAVEAVYLAVPHHLHQEMCCAAIQAGKHLMAEKPVGIDLAANRAIVDCAARHPEVFVRCASQFMFYPAVQRIGDLLDRALSDRAYGPRPTGPCPSRTAPCWNAARSVVSSRSTPASCIPAIWTRTSPSTGNA